jgi:hypothetical protein
MVNLSWLKRGKTIRVKCDIQPGPLGQELITINTEPTVLSGFINKNLVEKNGPAAYLKGQVVTLTPSAVNIKFPASFFTAASGIASIAREWAEKNMEPA